MTTDQSRNAVEPVDETFEPSFHQGEPNADRPASEPPPPEGVVGSLRDLGALSSLGEVQDLADAMLLLEIVEQIENWGEREDRLRSASGKLLAYIFSAVWSSKRSGVPVAWRLGFSDIPWSAAARALLVVEEGRIVVRKTGASRDPLTLEHVVPKRLIFTELRDFCTSGNLEGVVHFLHENTRLAVVSKEEGKGLAAIETRAPLAAELHQRAAMRRSALPDNEYLAKVVKAGLPWQWARYIEIGHDLASFQVLRNATDLNPKVRELLPGS